VPADPLEMYKQCVCALVHKWSDTWHPKDPPLRKNAICFSSPLPVGLTALPQVSSPSFEPVPAFSQLGGRCSPPAWAVAGGMQQTLPQRRAALGTVLCSGAVAKITLA